MNIQPSAHPRLCGSSMIPTLINFLLQYMFVLKYNRINKITSFTPEKGNFLIWHTYVYYTGHVVFSRNVITCFWKRQMHKCMLDHSGLQLRAGDTEMIECIYKVMLPLFNLAAEKQYLKIYWSKYICYRKRFKYLHLTRINRLASLYLGCAEIMQRIFV